jgi:hypothetical protein
MSLFPDENILTKEIESWKVIADSIESEEDKRLFGKPFPSEPLIMALLLEQHKMINWLENKITIHKQRFFKCS